MESLVIRVRVERRVLVVYQEDQVNQVYRALKVHQEIRDQSASQVCKVAQVLVELMVRTVSMVNKGHKVQLE